MGIPFRERLLHSAGAISSIDGGRHGVNITLRLSRKEQYLWIFLNLLRFGTVLEYNQNKKTSGNLRRPLSSLEPARGFEPPTY